MKINGIPAANTVNVKVDSGNPDEFNDKGSKVLIFFRPEEGSRIRCIYLLVPELFNSFTAWMNNH